ncbi:MAG: tol-pal system protein YbgF [Proteobacteria bacterium]|nr:tol-pal system protein YbgF [Pseudomonadota bacterium]
MMKKIFNFNPLLLLLLFGAGLLAMANPAFSQSSGDYDRLLERVEQIEKELRALQRSAARGRMASSSGEPQMLGPNQSALLADMEVRIGQLARELRELTGAIEQIIYTQNRLGRELDLFRKEVEFRFQNLGSGAAETADQMAATPPATPAIVLPEGTPKEQYEFSFQLLRKGDFAGAEAAFSAFLEQHPDDPLAGNAQYWLGETFYVRKNFPKAAEAFLKGFQSYGDSIKGPDSLFKLAMTLGAMGKPAEACAALAELEARYPDANPAIQAQTSAQKVRLAC